MAYKKQLRVTDKMTLTKAKITHGTQLFIPGKNAKFQDLPPPRPEKADDDEEEKIDTTNHSKHEPSKPVPQPTGGDEPMDGKKPGSTSEEKFINDAKHQPFDYMLKEMRAKCKRKHKPNQRCQDCLPIENISFKMKKGCTSHKPYPLGMCNKCLPPTCILNRQKYRHVDYISILNFREFQSFVDAWQYNH